MKKSLLAFALAVALSLLLAAQALGAPVVTDGLDIGKRVDDNRFYAGYWPRWAQSFTAKVGGTLDSAVFWLGHIENLGSDAGYVNAELWAITGTYGTNSVPAGVPLATSAPVNGAALPDGETPGPVTFRFSNSVTLKQGVRYAIVVHYVFQDSGATVEIARGAASTHPGNMSGFGLAYGSTWVTGIPEAGDLIFNVKVNRLKTPTSLSLVAPTVSAYRSATVYGYLRDVSGKALGSRPVAIRYLSSGVWKTVATVYTDSSGRFSRTLAPSVRTTYQASFSGDTSYAPTTSLKRVVLPRARLTRSSSWSTKRDGTTYYYKGFIEPRHSTSDANKVAFKLYKKGRDGLYHWKKTVTASYSYYSASKTRWTAKVVLPSAGRWRARAYHATDARNAAVYSSYDYFDVE